VSKHITEVNKDIIKIDYYTNIQEIKKDVIYESLKDSKNIGKTTKHHRLFKWSIKMKVLESNILFIIFGNANQVVSVIEIYLGIDINFVRWVQQIRDMREWIVISFLS